MSELSATVREPPGEPGATAPGTRYGRFVVERLLGYGGMGAVFAARDPELAREVAIKVLHSEPGSGGMSGEALRHEAQAMARLTHPNTVSVYEVGQAHGQTFIVMELIAGTTLRAWLDDRARPWPEIVAMFVRAGRGLEAAHRAGLVHRDFKPENVLVDGDGWPRVADFGLASVSFAKSGGTPAFMAPEQWLEGDVDARADQFSFAVALWRALVGAPPFPGDSRSDLSKAVLAGTISEPPEGCTMPAAVEAALRRALSRKPEARWPSLTELLHELERANAATARRPRWLVPVIAVVAVSMGLAIALLARPDRDGELAPIAEVKPFVPDAAPQRMFWGRGEQPPGKAPYKLTDSPEDLEELINRYVRELNYENLVQTSERLILITEEPRQRSAHIVNLGNRQAGFGECDAAKNTLKRYLAGFHEEPWAKRLEESIATCEANRPAPPVRVPGKDGTGVGLDEVKLLSGATDPQQVRVAIERIARRFRSCAEEARRGGLRIDHVGIDTDIKADGSFAPGMYEDTDDAGFVRCLSTTFAGLKLHGAKPGRVKFTMWFDD